jgi:hypothetical protein
MYQTNNPLSTRRDLRLLRPYGVATHKGQHAVPCKDDEFMNNLLVLHQMHWLLFQIRFDLRCEDSHLLRRPSLHTHQEPQQRRFEHLYQVDLVERADLLEILILRPRANGHLADFMLHISEPSFFSPSLQMLARRAATTHLVASLIEDFGKLQDLVIFALALVFGVGERIEVMEFDEATRSDLAE